LPRAHVEGSGPAVRSVFQAALEGQTLAAKRQRVDADEIVPEADGSRTLETLRVRDRADPQRRLARARQPGLQGPSVLEDERGLGREVDRLAGLNQAPGHFGLETPVAARVARSA